MNGTDERTGRDGRLLALVIVVSLAVLLLLARFRFPATDGVADGARTRAARAADGAIDLRRSGRDDCQRRATRAIDRGRASSRIRSPESEKAGGKSRRRSRRSSGRRVSCRPCVSGRIWPSCTCPRGSRSRPGWDCRRRSKSSLSDPQREIVVVRAPSLFETSNGVTNAADGFAGFSYVAVVEATSGGLTAAPVFIGRTDSPKRQPLGGRRFWR